MAVEVVANPYSWWMWLFKTKCVVKTACMEQGKAVMDVSFVIRAVLKAML